MGYHYQDKTVVRQSYLCPILVRHLYVEMGLSQSAERLGNGHLLPAITALRVLISAPALKLFLVTYDNSLHISSFVLFVSSYAPK